MSILPLFKKCSHCGKKYTYNPSVGKFGLICPHCKWPNLDQDEGDKKKIVIKYKTEK